MRDSIYLGVCVCCGTAYIWVCVCLMLDSMNLGVCDAHGHRSSSAACIQWIPAVEELRRSVNAGGGDGLRAALRHAAQGLRCSINTGGSCLAEQHKLRLFVPHGKTNIQAVSTILILLCSLRWALGIIHWNGRKRYDVSSFRDIHTGSS